MLIILILTSVIVGLFFQADLTYAQEPYLLKTLKGQSDGLDVVEYDKSGYWILGASKSGIVIWDKDGILMFRNTPKADLKSKLIDAITINDQVFYSRMYHYENSLKQIVGYGELASWGIGTETTKTFFSEKEEPTITKPGLFTVNAIAGHSAKNIVAVSLTYSAGLGRKNVGSIRILESISGTRLHDLNAFPEIRSMRFDASGDLLVAVAKDKAIGLWQTNSGGMIWTRSGHTQAITSVAFSPDSRYIVTGSDDKTVILWDAATGKQIRQYSGHLGTPIK
ncbi:MAG: WD40 repeat domain-containing protein [candidate division KSB1 bacterium]